MTSRTELTREVEFRRCARDPIYFLNTYWQIEVVGSSYEVTGLRAYQEADVTRMLGCTTGGEKERQIRLKARQIGYTTVACGFAFWDAFFHPHHPWIITQQSEDEAYAEAIELQAECYEEGWSCAELAGGACDAPD